MKIRVRDLSFGYPGRRRAEKHAGRRIFSALNADLDGGTAGRPLVILGTSGCGKTTFLKLLGGLFTPLEGRIIYPYMEGQDENSPILIDGEAGQPQKPPKCAFIFQEPRLLPWLTVLENVSLPLEKDLGKTEALSRARHFLSMVFLEDKEGAFPEELSGGQAQRVSMARAFAWPAPVLLMDEPFQSLDIPLRLSLMDLCLSLLGAEKNRLLIAVIHDPREALYMAGRIMVLGAAREAGEGRFVYDKIIDLSPEDRAYGSATMGKLEKEIISVLQV